MSPVLRLVIFLLLAFRLQLIRSQSQNGGIQNSFSDLFAWNKPAASLSTRSMSKNELPRLQEIAEVIPRNEFFYGMNPNHMRATLMVRDLLAESNSTDDFINMAANLRDRGEINPHAWLRAVVSESIHRPEMDGLRLPPIAEVMPSLFIPSEVLDAVGESANDTTRNNRCTLIDGDVGRDNGDENRLWYFREDIMVNSFHWYWHLAYPLTGERGEQDRVGELFYFTHHDLMARYHSERLSVGLRPVRAFNMRKAGTPIPVPYNPHMRDGNSGREWSARPRGVRVADVDISSDVIHDRDFRISLRTRAAQLRRLRDGIRDGTLMGRNGQRIDLRTDEGITILGNTFEANNFSVNPELYGRDGVHNEGHIIISLAQDPRFERRIPPGVMGDTATAMRDVIFYSYHKFVDNVFSRYKRTLPPYQLQGGSWPLSLEGIQVHGLKVTSAGLPQNVLNTFWSIKRFDLSKGLDFQRTSGQGPLWTCAKHLDHQEFVYELDIDRRRTARARTATVRIFMGPRFDLSGRRYSLEEQRHLMFMMDTFTVSLKYGVSKIYRRSSLTPLTIDFPQSVAELGATSNNTRPFCGCGWPRHLLIPKGTREGLSMDVFVIVTDSRADSVGQGNGGSTSEPENGCRPAYIFCGLMNRKYPDARPMGYPFDRKLYLSEQRSSQPVIMEDLVREIPNSGHARVSIVHRKELTNFGPGFRSSFSSSIESPEDLPLADNAIDSSSSSSSEESSNSVESSLES